MLYTSLVLCLWTLIGHVIVWRFGVYGPVIARIKRSVNINPIYDDNETEMFRDRLKMNNQTGDLTITHITSQHSGLYHLHVTIGTQQTVKHFSLSVGAPSTVSISEYTQTPSSSSSSSSSESSGVSAPTAVSISESTQTPSSSSPSSSPSSSSSSSTIERSGVSGI
ncbi:uncharacterized protein DDB_G0271670-like [Triplophysa rosa]|uniref:uncharacterized protein DDB_G0271670-like n=1 Tax=Triplophysa rosa TaxID=992332 RepID=UPI002545E02D|nr:uncharacterized protein DDB_G0271670-like [Triplophysa rosa]